MSKNYDGTIGRYNKNGELVPTPSEGSKADKAIAQWPKWKRDLAGSEGEQDAVTHRRTCLYWRPPDVQARRTAREYTANEIRSLHKRISDLEAENARLREAAEEGKSAFSGIICNCVEGCEFMPPRELREAVTREAQHGWEILKQALEN